MSTYSGDDQATMHDVSVQGGDPNAQFGQAQYGQTTPYDQSAYIGGQPASGAAYVAPPAAANVATGCNGAAIKRVVTSPDGILRLLEWLLAVISFGAMSNTSFYSQQSSFQFLVAAGVLAWLWTMFMLFTYIFDIHSSKPIFNLVEFLGDLLWAFFEFVAGIAAAAQCNKTIPTTTISYCDGSAYGSKPKAAAAFAFLCCFTLLGSAFFSFKKWRSSK